MEFLVAGAARDAKGVADYEHKIGTVADYEGIILRKEFY